MPVISSEIVTYGSQNMPENNSTASGGSIDTTTKVIFTDISANDTIEVLSSSGSDTSQDVTITGRDNTGVIVSDTINLDGTNVQTTTQAFSRILKIVMSGTAVGTVTVRKQSDDVTIATLEPGLTTIRRLFYDSSADSAGGDHRDYYEKVFIKNTNSTTALTNVTIDEYADSTSKVTFAIASGMNDNSQASGRLNTIPTGMVSGSFNGLQKSTGSLGPSSGLGVWLKLSLTGGSPAATGYYTLRVQGTST